MTTRSKLKPSVWNGSGDPKDLTSNELWNETERVREAIKRCHSAKSRGMMVGPELSLAKRRLKALTEEQQERAVEAALGRDA